MLNGSSPLLRAGMTAEVDITYTNEEYQNALTQLPNNQINSSSHESMIVPVSAVGAGLNQSKFVFVYNEASQTVTKRNVIATNILGNEVFIASGLKAGEIIAIAGVSFLREGQKVSLLDDNVQRFN